MRTKAFWEEKLDRALDQERELGNAKLIHTVKLRMAKGRWRRRAKYLSEEKRLELRGVINLETSRIAKIDRKLNQLQETKIPYYREMVERPHRTAWDHIRREAKSRGAIAPRSSDTST